MPHSAPPSDFEHAVSLRTHDSALTLKGQDIARRRWIGLAAIAVLLFLQMGLLCGGMPRSLHGSTDFRAFYATGKLVALHRGKDIYNLGLQADAQHEWISKDDQTLPFLYPAFAALLFVPFGFLPFTYAFVAFEIANLAMFVFIAGWVAKELDAGDRCSPWLAAALTFGSISSTIVLLQGQISCLLTCVFIAVLALVRRGRESLAGMVLSLLAAKFQIAIPIALLLCAWRRWALIRGMLSGVALLALVSFIVAGSSGTMQYVHMISGLTQATAADPLAAKALYGMFPSDMPNIHGAAYVLAAAKPVSMLITILISGLLILWAARRDRGIPSALCVAMLVSYHFQAYDLTLLLIPISVSLGELRREDTNSPLTRAPKVRRMLRARLGLILVACGLLIVPVGAAVVYNRMSWVFVIAVIAVLSSFSLTSKSGV